MERDHLQWFSYFFNIVHYNLSDQKVEMILLKHVDFYYVFIEVLTGPSELGWQVWQLPHQYLRDLLMPATPIFGTNLRDLLLTAIPIF